MHLSENFVEDFCFWMFEKCNYICDANNDNYNLMKCFTKVFIATCCMLLVCSCFPKQVGGSDTPVETINWSSFKNAPFDQSILSRFKAIDTVILDKEGPGNASVSSVDKVLLSNNSFYVLDAMRRIVSEYDYTGKAIRTIGQQGRGPEEYTRISDFSISPNSGIWILDGSTDYLFHYANSGEYLEKSAISVESSALHALENGDFLMGVSLWDDSTYKDSYVILCDKSQNITSSMAPNKHTIDANFTFPSTGFCETGEGFSYLVPLEDIVYVFDKEGRNVKNYFFDFSPATIPDEARANVENHMEAINNSTFLIISTYIDSSSIIGNVREKGDFGSFIIDRHSGSRYMTGQELGYFFGVSNGRAIFVKDTPEGFTLYFLDI